MFLKTSTKQAYSKLLQTGGARSSFGRMLMPASATAVNSHATMTNFSKMGFLSAKKVSTRSVMGSFEKRAFSLPEHIVMEMPNLSPTMEKVSELLVAIKVT